MPSKKRYWKSIEELKALDLPSGKGDGGFSPKSTTENFVPDDSFSRRDFMRASGFGLAAAMVAGCEGPIQKAIPFVVKPEEIFSGLANYYASSFIDGSDYCSIVVKTREGRPIKIEGNELSGITKGGTSARVQASVLSLYDEEKRLHGPLHKKNPTTWDRIDENVVPLLRSFSAQGRKIVILSQSIVSPSTKSIYEEFVSTYPGTRVVYYDPLSSSAMLMANQHSFGKQIIPHYRFDKADLIVSFSADFLGTWLSPIEFSKQYVQNRKLDGKESMSRHYQFESGMSLTGSNADYRFPVKPSEEGLILASLYNELARLADQTIHEIDALDFDLKPLAAELWKKRGKSIVVSGCNDPDHQILTNAINILLNNYGNTIDLSKPVNLKQGTDEDVINLVEEMNGGLIDTLIINQVNPVYDYPEPNRFIEGLAKVRLSISLSSVMDETAALVTYVCPDNHFLESWNDAEPVKGFYSLSQPTIHRLFDTRAIQDGFLRWMEKDTTYYDYLLAFWKNNIFPLREYEEGDGED
ncbi:MAG: 4Fe-4S ferredoxin, partial [Saprospiraceae bacterium]|nr:4Fe-4S ferredoxin [Saprospiraceae bacterium]